MKKRWIAVLAVIFCLGWFAPVRTRAAEQMVIQRIEDCVSGKTTDFRYDKNGRTIRKTDSDGNSETYSYYADGTLKTELKYFRNKPAQFTRYDASGNEQLIKTWNSDGTIRNQRYQHTYDERGKLCETRYTDSIGDEIQGFTLLSYGDYDDEGAIWVERKEFYTESDEMYHHIGYTYYDAEGRLMGSEYYDIVSGGGEGITNFYDEHGTLVSSYRSDASMRDWTYEYENKYDSKGYLVRQDGKLTTCFLDNSADPIVESFAFQYRYDQSGRMISKEYYEFGELYETWTWEYDQYGNVLKIKLGDAVQEEYRYTYVPLSKAQRWN